MTALRMQTSRLAKHAAAKEAGSRICNMFAWFCSVGTDELVVRESAWAVCVWLPTLPDELVAGDEAI